MPLIAFEWPELGRVRWSGGAAPVRDSASLVEFVGQLAEPTTIVARTDPRLVLPDVRREIKAILEPGGHRLVVVSQHARAVLGAASGLAPEGAGPAALHRLIVRGANWIDHELAGRFDWRHVRQALDVAHEAALAGAVASGAPSVIEILGRLEILDAERRAVLGDGSGHHLDLVDAIWRAATASSSRPQFERYLTLTDAPTTGAMAATVRARTKESLERARLDGSGLTFSDVRRSLRCAYAAIHQDRQPTGAPA